MSELLIEVKEKRNLTTKVFQRPDGQRLHQMHIRHIHFQDWDDQIKDIDTRIVKTVDGFEMKKAAYDFEAVKAVETGKLPFQFINERNPIGLMPRGLRWANKEVVFQDMNNVEGRVEESRVVYPGAFGEADLVLEAMNTGLRKVVQINSNPVAPVGVEFLEVGFEFVVPEDAEIWYQDPSTIADVNRIRAELKSLEADRRECEKLKMYKQGRVIYARQQALEIELHDAMLVKWDKVFDKRFQGEYQVRHNRVKTYGRVPMVWDSAGKRQAIEIDLRKRNSKLYFVKIIPTSFLNEAVFPVFTDTTTSYFAGSGDGYVRNTGTGGQSFATVRNAASGTENSETDSSSANSPMTLYNSTFNWYRVGRNFYPIDTSGIDDGATISSASFKVKCNASGPTDSDGISAYIIQTSQASTTALENTDYSAVAFTSGGSKTLASMAANTYQSFTLDATGLGWISKTGTTKLGLILEQDLNGSPNPSASGNAIGLYYSEESGTGNDPYLEVVTADPATSYKYLLLMGVG